MLEGHVIYKNWGSGGCSIKIFTLESWIIVISRVISHVNLKTHRRERKYACDDRRENRASEHTNRNTIATCGAFFSVVRGDCGGDAKTGAKTGAKRDKNVTFEIALVMRFMEFICFFFFLVQGF